MAKAREAHMKDLRRARNKIASQRVKIIRRQLGLPPQHTQTHKG